ncbi:hypothetical protein [Paenibacillus sp. DMB20]|uniref:hypothetical protein n=1 Tax=Paenibacillus sp. DMB20 TaxID=1642570 RepID=UPI000627D90A|nr:hypothetical protein [Paenibacillus sp. DMB20]KKO52824.1 hypothetical protein XI25_16340 [Paenibacillus sp. DMB20]
MAEWSAIAAAAGMLIIAAAVIGITVTFRRLLLRTEAVLIKLEGECTGLSKEAAQVLERASVSMDSIQRQLAAGESIAASMSEAAAAAAKTAEAVQAVGKRASQTAVEHLERARLENERLIGDLFRWVDAGVTFWQVWNRRTTKSGDGHAE